MLNVLQAGEPGTSKSDEINEKNCYVDLVTRRVAQYIQQSQEYIASTDLAKKVAKRHNDIRPKLEKVEKREKFDIHKYRSEILSHFPKGNAKTMVNFSKVVIGKDREETCRYYLTASLS